MSRMACMFSAMVSVLISHAFLMRHSRISQFLRLAMNRRARHAEAASNRMER
jgi:hypothetical protein